MIYALALAASAFTGPATKLSSSRVVRSSAPQMFTVELITPDGTSSVRMRAIDTQPLVASLPDAPAMRRSASSHHIELREP